MPSRARIYFDELKAIGADGLLALINANESRFEGDWLEYKSGDDLDGYVKATSEDSGVPGPEAVKLKNKLKDEWAKCLSAFSNNEGGVVVWGIHAVARSGVDAPHDERRIHDLTRAESGLRTLSDKLTDPPVSNLEFVTIPLKKGANEGFLLVYIPEGQLRPYRAESNLKRFYFRSGASSNVATVSMVRMMFTTFKRHSGMATFIYKGKRGIRLHEMEFWFRNTSVYTIRKTMIGLVCDGAPFCPQQDDGLELHDDRKVLIFQLRVNLNYNETTGFTFRLVSDNPTRISLMTSVSVEDSYPLKSCVSVPLPWNGQVESEMHVVDVL